MVQLVLGPLGQVAEPTSALAPLGSLFCRVASHPCHSGAFRGQMGVGERAWEDPGIVPCTHNKRKNHRLLEITCLKFSELGWGWRQLGETSLRFWGRSSSSRKAQDLTEMWVSFGLLSWFPDLSWQDSPNYFLEKPFGAFSFNGQPAPAIMCQALSQAQGHQRWVSSIKSQAFLKPILYHVGSENQRG